MTLFSGFDITPFLSRPSVPYTPPKATDVSPIMNALDSFGQMMQLQQRRKEAEAQRALEQQRIGLQQSGQDETKRYHDIENQRYQASDARLSKAETDKHIAEIQKALPDAQASGDQAKVQALLQELGRVTGWQMGEYQTNHQAPEAAPPPSSAPPTGPTDFDQAYQAMVQKESGGNPRAINPKSGAMGTFQLMPEQLQAMGLTKDQFLAMTPEQQRQIYETKYLPAHGLSRDTLAPGDVGLSVGAPAAIAMPDDAVVYPKGSKAVAQNPTWDRNHDGQITRVELRENYGGAPAGPPAGIAAPPAEAPPTGPAPFLKDFMGQQLQAPDQAPSGSMPWEMLGLGNPPAPGPQKPEEEVQGGGRYVFRDAAGKVAYEYDRTKVQADQRTAVQSGLQPLLDNATTDEEKKAARSAIGFASAAVGNGLNPKEAYTQGLAFYEKSMGETGKTARAGVSSEWGQQKQLQLDSDRVHQQTAQQFGLAKLEASAIDVRNGLAALDAHNGFGDTIALGRLMKDLEGGRVTDADYNRYANSTGWLNNALNIGNRILNGEQNPELVSQLRTVLQNQSKYIDQQRSVAADVAGQAIMSGSQYSLITPEQRQQYANRARQRILGGQVEAGAPAPSAGQAPGSGYGAKSMDELERELGGGP